MVKPWPYQQTTVSGAAHSKLAKRFYGPFHIIERMGPVAYKLALPENSRIHLVFHCSILKPFIGSPTSEQAMHLPPLAMDNQPIPAPLAILAHKTVPSNTSPKHLVLVQWQGLHPDEASWEEWSTIKSLHHLEDKVLFEVGGNDTSGRNKLQIAKPKRQSNAPLHLKDYVLDS